MFFTLITSVSDVVIMEINRVVEAAKFDGFNSGYKQTNCHQREQYTVCAFQTLILSPGRLLKERIPIQARLHK
jgi:hypothetical protein